MLVLSRKIHEKIILPDLHTTIQVVGVKAHTVRLGIDAPPEVRILREEVPDRVSEWGTSPEDEDDPSSLSLVQLNQLLQKRLDIARHGLQELRRQMFLGETEDLDITLDRLDEDLQLLQERVQHEVVPCERELVGEG